MSAFDSRKTQGRKAEMAVSRCLARTGYHVVHIDAQYFGAPRTSPCAEWDPFGWDFGRRKIGDLTLSPTASRSLTMPDLLIFGRRYVDGPRLRLWGEVKLRERAFAGSYWVPRDQMWHFADLQTESGIMVIYLIVDAAERRIYSAPLSTLWELGFGPSCQADRVLIEQARLYRGCKIPPEIPI